MNSDSYPFKRRILIYGPPKCGKSGSLGRVPKGTKMFLVDADNQAGEMVKVWKQTQGDMKGLEIVKLPEVTMDDESHKKAVFKAHRDALWRPPSGFHIYAVDGWTKVGLNLTHCIVGKVERHYNQHNNQMLSSTCVDLWFQFVNRAEREGAWVITVAWEKWLEEVKDPEGDLNDYRNKIAVVRPDIATQAKTIIPGNCDFVWRVEKARRIVAGKNVKMSTFRTQGTDVVMASSVGFSDKLDRSIDADFAKFLALVEPKKGRTPSSTKASTKASSKTTTKKPWQRKKA